MTIQSLKKRYPWYGRHATAVNTLTAFMVVDVVDILRQLDRRRRRPGFGPAAMPRQRNLSKHWRGLNHVLQ